MTDQQLERSISYYQRCVGWTWPGALALHPTADATVVLVTTRADRYWLKGDVFVASFLTGAGRQMVIGISSKGRRFRNFWLSNLPPHQEALWVEVPCDLATISPSDTGPIRRAIAAAHA